MARTCTDVLNEKGLEGGVELGMGDSTIFYGIGTLGMVNILTPEKDFAILGKGKGVVCSTSKLLNFEIG
jgi:hypothetical protein